MFATLIAMITILIAYFVGSVCSAVIICKMSDLPDPRTEGSKNPGATNVLRLGGKKHAAMVLVADMLKGLLPVLLAKLFGAGPTLLGFVALAAVLGHIFPVFFEFKGGKGVATALGALFGIHFMLGVLALATWLLVANFSRYSSLASIVSISLAPFYSIYFFHSAQMVFPLIVIALFVLYKHHQNITRLVDGTESKLNFKDVD